MQAVAGAAPSPPSPSIFIGLQYSHEYSALVLLETYMGGPEIQSLGRKCRNTEVINTNSGGGGSILEIYRYGVQIPHSSRAMFHTSQPLDAISSMHPPAGHPAQQRWSSPLLVPRGAAYALTDRTGHLHLFHKLFKLSKLSSAWLLAPGHMAVILEPSYRPLSACPTRTQARKTQSLV